MDPTSPFTLVKIEDADGNTHQYEIGKVPQADGFVLFGIINGILTEAASGASETAFGFAVMAAMTSGDHPQLLKRLLRCSRRDGVALVLEPSGGAFDSGIYEGNYMEAMKAALFSCRVNGFFPAGVTLPGISLENEEDPQPKKRRARSKKKPTA